MRQAKQVELMKHMLQMIDDDSTEDAGQLVKNPTASYVSKDIAEREWETMFENHAQIIGLSGDLPEPGSFLTTHDLGIPILATRDKEGHFHAFVNACRHRGAVLTEDARGKQNRFACPFHAWTYASNGQLLGIREPKKFGDLDKSCYGLVELPSVEKYGLLVVHPREDGEINVDELLGADLVEEIQSWKVDEATYSGGRELEKDMNWKLAIDTFGENYHFHTLHSNHLDALFYGDATAYDEYGRNHRLSLASRYIDVMREQPEKAWNVTDAGIVVYYLFPNVQLVLVNRTMILFRIYPDRNDATRSITRASFYDAPHIGSQLLGETEQELNSENLYEADTKQRMEFNSDTLLEIINSTLELEDYYMAEKSQLAASSGRVEHFVFGRNEPALQHFHRGFRDALDMSPMEAIRSA